MKFKSYEFPKSSFLGMAKDTSLIINKILSNKKVLRLLYHTQPDCLEGGPEKDLTTAQVKELFSNGQISNVPRLQVSPEFQNYLRISYNYFTPNDTNPYYRDHIIEIRIICHFDNWNLGDFELRPYRIAGEIDAMLNNQHLTGIGLLNFISAEQNIYDSEFGGITLNYLAIHGNEDKVNPLE